MLAYTSFTGIHTVFIFLITPFGLLSRFYTRDKGSAEFRAENTQNESRFQKKCGFLKNMPLMPRTCAPGHNALGETMISNTFTIELVRTALRVLNHRPDWPPRAIAEALNTPKHEIETLLRSAKHVVFDEAKIHGMCQIILEKFRDDEELSLVLPLFATHNERCTLFLSLITKYIFSVDDSNFKDCSDYLSGTYICHKYTSGDDIITDVLVIKPYDARLRLSTFCAYYKHRESPTIYDAMGYILPVSSGYYVLCGVSHDMRESPDPYFVVIEHPSYNYAPYLRGISLDTDEWQRPWASIVYCGRAPQGTEERKADILTTRTLGEFTESFQRVLLKAIGRSSLRFEKNYIDVGEQSMLCDPLAYIVKTGV